MNQQQYQQLVDIVFRLDTDGKPTYPGYRPEVREIPHGDGKVDAEKRYAHVATKYLAEASATLAKRQFGFLWDVLDDAHRLSLSVADELRVPAALGPVFSKGALRVLEYPVGATSNLHTDFDLFTLMIFRDQPECFVAHEPRRDDPGGWTRERIRNVREARKLNAQLHIGELGELIGLGPATPHEVIASDKPQHAIVYFAIPDHAAVLPTGQTVGEWLKERMARSRM